MLFQLGQSDGATKLRLIGRNALLRFIGAANERISHNFFWWYAHSLSIGIAV